MPKAKRILVAEDERPMSRALVLKLQKSGFEAVPAYNGEEALEEIEKGTFDLILLDLVMPKLDGFGVLEELRKRKVKTKVVVSTNLSQQEDEKRARELGAVGFYVKSDTPIARIVELVSAML